MSIKEEEERDLNLNELDKKFSIILENELKYRNINFNSKESRFCYKGASYFYECSRSSAYNWNEGITIMNCNNNEEFILFIVNWKNGVFKLSTATKEYLSNRSYDELILKNSGYELFNSESSSLEELVGKLCDELFERYLSMIDNRSIERKIKFLKSEAQIKLDELKKALVYEVKTELVKDLRKAKFDVEEDEAKATINGRTISYLIKQYIGLSEGNIADEFEIKILLNEEFDRYASITYESLIYYSEHEVTIKTNHNLRNIEIILKDEALEESIKKLVEVVKDYFELGKKNFLEKWKKE